MIIRPLTEDDLDRGRAPDLKSPHWRCRTVDPATGAVRTRRPHRDDQQHQGHHAVQGTGRSTRLTTWTGGTERAMVVNGYSWNRLPGTDVEVRALTDKPLLGAPQTTVSSPHPAIWVIGRTPGVQPGQHARFEDSLYTPRMHT
jgi:hypothetical protein